MTDFLHDYPAHPTGIVVHPEWSNVRDRWNTLHCNRVMNEAQEREEADRERTNPGVFIAIVAVLLVGMAFVGAIDGMIR